MRRRRRASSRLLLLAAALGITACGRGDLKPTAETGTEGGRADLTVDAARAGASARVIWQFFEPGDCAIAEGCIARPGLRRLVRFETFTVNHGTADLELGAPGNHPEHFRFSPCHRHYHYDGYADYRLLDAGGREVGVGHKQAFCLEDSSRVDPSAASRARFTCDFQGISRGWGDSYDPGLDCQWIDVTDVAPGSYTLRIIVNGNRQLPELSYADNVASLAVRIPDDAGLDPTAPCAGTLEGPRDCGWANGGAFGCAPGARLRVACGSACGLGGCTGDPILRVCGGDAPCSSREALAYDDDGCGGNSLCPLITFTCPASGRYTVMTAPYRAGDAYTCQFVAAP